MLRLVIVTVFGVTVYVWNSGSVRAGSVSSSESWSIGFMETKGSISRTESVDELNIENILAVMTDEAVATATGVGKWSKHSWRQQVPCTHGCWSHS